MLFQSGHLILIKNEDRKYFGFSQIDDSWEIKNFYSKTNLWHKQTKVFFDKDDVVRKIIHEEIKAYDMKLKKSELLTAKRRSEHYCEYDTSIKTDNREFVLPITKKGVPKKLNPTNLMAFMPDGIRFSLDINHVDDETFMGMYHPKSGSFYPMGEAEKISGIRNNDDFQEFAKYYIRTCPKDYLTRLEKLKSAKKLRVKIENGSIFRMQYDRFNYTYGLILGRAGDFINIKPTPKEHSFNALMMQPLLIRFYDIITESDDLSAKDLREIPLCPLQICSDAEIFWGCFPIIDTKTLCENDLDFHFICTKIISKNPHNNKFTQDFLMESGIIKKENYKLYIEWGFTQVEIPKKKISYELNNAIADYYSPFNGVSMGIYPRYCGKSKEELLEYHDYKNDLLAPHNSHILALIMENLGVSKEISFDEFANKFGGLTKAEILEKLFLKEAKK